MSNEGYLKIQTCVLKVNIHCEDCKRKVKKILHDIEGVYITKLEIDSKKVTVLGNVDPNILIKTLVKKGKRAEIWDAQTSHTNMTENLQIDNGNTGGKKMKKSNTGNGGNQSKGVGGGHSQWSELTPQQKLQLQSWQQQQMTKLTPFKDPKLFMPMPIIKNQNQMQKLKKAVRFNIPDETDEDETSGDEEEDSDDQEEEDDDCSFPQQLPFNKMNTTSKPMMTVNGMFNSGQGNLSGQMNGNGKNIQNLYGQTVGGMQNQAGNNGRWSNGMFNSGQGNLSGQMNGNGKSIQNLYGQTVRGMQNQVSNNGRWSNGMFNSGQGNLSGQMNGNEKNIQNLYGQTVGGMQNQVSNNGRWSNGMFNSGQGNLSGQMNGKNIQNLYGQTVGGMQIQASNNGRWSNDNFTMNMGNGSPGVQNLGNGSLGVQNLGNGYPPNMAQTSNMPMGYRPLVMSGNNPYYQQQQLAVGMMNQPPSSNNERFQPTMSNQPPPVTNYMPHSYPQPSVPYMYALSDENTSSCNVM